MDLQQALEAEQIFNELERDESLLPKINKLKEIFSPMIENEKLKQFKREKNLKYSWNGFNPNTEIAKAINVLSNSISFYNEATEEIETLQNETSDILHALELTDLNDEELTKLMRELKQIRIHRRIAKHFVEILYPLYNFVNKNNQMIKQLGQIHGEMTKIQNTIENKKYYVKEKITLKDHFENASDIYERVKKLKLVR